MAGQVDEQRQRLPFRVGQADCIYQRLRLFDERPRWIKLGFDFNQPLDLLAGELLNGGGFEVSRLIGDLAE